MITGNPHERLQVKAYRFVNESIFFIAEFLNDHR
jgi:hypothetical protein